MSMSTSSGRKTKNEFSEFVDSVIYSADSSSAENKAHKKRKRYIHDVHKSIYEEAFTVNCDP